MKIILSLLILLYGCANNVETYAIPITSGITIEIGAEDDNIDSLPIKVRTVQLRIRPDKYGWQNSLLMTDVKISQLKLLNIKAVLSVDGFPENAEYNQASPLFWASDDDLEEVVRFAFEISERYANENQVIAYQFMSEPVNLEGGAHYPIKNDQLNLDIIAAIRSNTNREKIIIAQSVWGFCENQKVIDRKGIIYGCHYYSPHFMTHQGIRGNPDNIHWPVMYNNVLWNKKKIRQTLQSTIDFKVNNDVDIFIGEFGCLRWGPDCNRYLIELTDIFKRNHFTYMYYQLNGWNGWNPNYSHVLSNDPASDYVGYNSERWATLKKIYR